MEFEPAIFILIASEISNLVLNCSKHIKWTKNRILRSSRNYRFQPASRDIYSRIPLSFDSWSSREGAAAAEWLFYIHLKPLHSYLFKEAPDILFVREEAGSVTETIRRDWNGGIAADYPHNPTISETLSSQSQRSHVQWKKERVLLLKVEFECHWGRQRAFINREPKIGAHLRTNTPVVPLRRGLSCPRVRAKKNCIYKLKGNAKQPADRKMLRFCYSHLFFRLATVTSGPVTIRGVE